MLLTFGPVSTPGRKGHLSQLVSNVWESLAGSDTQRPQAPAAASDVPERPGGGMVTLVGDMFKISLL